MTIPRPPVPLSIVCLLAASTFRLVAGSHFAGSDAFNSNQDYLWSSPDFINSTGSPEFEISSGRLQYDVIPQNSDIVRFWGTKASQYYDWEVVVDCYAPDTPWGGSPSPEYAVWAGLQVLRGHGLADSDFGDLVSHSALVDADHSVISTEGFSDGATLGKVETARITEMVRLRARFSASSQQLFLDYLDGGGIWQTAEIISDPVALWEMEPYEGFLIGLSAGNEAGSPSVQVAFDNFETVTSEPARRPLASYEDPFDDLARWATGPQFGSGMLALESGVIEYTVADPSGDDFAGIDCIYEASYDSDWEVAVDAHLMNASLPEDNWANLNLIVCKSDSLRDHLTIAIDRDGRPWQGIGTWFRIGGAEIAQPEVSSTTQDASLRITYDASSRTLKSFYDLTGSADGPQWVEQFSADISQPATDWGMSTGDTFRIVLIGGSGNTAISSGDAVFDNFRATAETYRNSLSNFSYDRSTGDGEVTIVAAPGSRWRLMASPDLDFSSASEVNLTGATLGIRNGNLITTDSNGRSTVQFQLGQDSRSFLRGERQ